MLETLSSSGVLDLVRIVGPLIVGAIGGALAGEYLGVKVNRAEPESSRAITPLATALGTIAGGVVGVALAGGF